MPGTDDPPSAIIPERETIWSWMRAELENKYADAEDTTTNGGNTHIRQAAAVIHESPPNRLVAALDEWIARRIEHFTQQPPENMQWTFSVLAWGMGEAGIRNLFRSDAIRAEDMIHQAGFSCQTTRQSPISKWRRGEPWMEPTNPAPGMYSDQHVRVGSTAAVMSPEASAELMQRPPSGTRRNGRRMRYTSTPEGRRARRGPWPVDGPQLRW